MGKRYTVSPLLFIPLVLQELTKVVSTTKDNSTAKGKEL